MRKIFSLLVFSFIVFLLSAKPGDYKSLGGGWSEVGGITSIGYKLYIISSGTLYETTTNGKYKSLGSGWTEIGGATSIANKLYIISGKTLYSADIN